MFGFGHSGSAPAPFDGLNGSRLAGPVGSHPLHEVRAAQLIRSSDQLLGEITLDGPARVGDGLTGTIRVTASEGLSARGAAFRLVGLRLDEVRREREQRDSQGRVISREEWVEAQGRLFVEQTFVEPHVPADLAAGVTWEARFAVPAPPLGPPSAHLGESIVAWALEVRWDRAMSGDIRLATLLVVSQNRDLQAAGVGRQGGQSLMASVAVGDAAIEVTSPLPAPAGSDLLVRVRWPAAPSGRGGRVELHRRTNAPNAVEGIIASTAVDPTALRSGADVTLTVPKGAAPSFDGAGLENRYVLRALVDRALFADAAIERPIGVV